MLDELNVSRALELLSCSRLFEGFGREELASWLPRLEPSFAQYQREEAVFNEESPAEKLAIVASGEFYASKRGGPSLMNIYRTGNLLGLPEYSSTRRTWARTCCCSVPGELLWLSPRGLMDAKDNVEEMRQNLRFRDNLEKMMANSAVKLFYHVEVISTQPLRERILLFLRMMCQRYGAEGGEVRLRMNRSQLAEYLAVDRSTLSRELAKLEKSGEVKLKDSYTYHLFEK